jgi:hypothetical protein
VGAKNRIQKRQIGRRQEKEKEQLPQGGAKILPFKVFRLF